MAYYYRFIERSSGVEVKLSEIDDQMRKQIGWPPDATRYCSAYTMTTMAGLELAIRAKDKPITRDLFEAYKAERAECFDSEDWSIMEQYLLTDYEFKVHYTR